MSNIRWLVVATLLIVTGCSHATADPLAARDQSKPLVVATFTVLADIAREVGGEHIRVESLVPAGANLHTFEPTPGDLHRMKGAALFLDNGMGLESSFARFFARFQAPHVVVSEGVAPLPLSHFPPSPRRANTSVASANPHAWLSPTAGQRYVASVVRALTALDPQHHADFERRGQQLQEFLHQVLQRTRTTLAELPPSRRLLVTCEGAFGYLVNDLNLSEAFLWPLNSDQQVTPHRMAALTHAVTTSGLGGVLCESTVSPALMQRVAQSTGTALAGTLYVDSLSDLAGPAATYRAMIEHTCALVVAALTQRPPA